MPRLLFLLLLGLCHHTYAQVNGGAQSMSFLRLPQSPHVSALGGLVVASPSADVMFSLSNPALLRPEFHTQLGLNYNGYYSGTRISHLYYAHHQQNLKTTFGLGFNYVNYGTFNLTDALGQSQGTAKAADFVFSLTASRAYLERWRYGAALKYAGSTLPNARSFAVLADIGVVYADTGSQWYMGAAVKNAGVTLRRYDPTVPQSLPLDLQIGVTKKFKKAPFSLMVLAHHLTRWDIRYDNPADAVNNELLLDNTQTTKEKTYFADKLFRHFVFALDVNLGKRLEISAGYNHLRRGELSLTDKKGLSGFSFGGGLYLNRFTIHYARSYYHLAGAYNEVGISIAMNRLFGLGDLGNKINWSEKFAKEYR